MTYVHSRTASECSNGAVAVPGRAGSARRASSRRQVLRTITGSLSVAVVSGLKRLVLIKSCITVQAVLTRPFGHF